MKNNEFTVDIERLKMEETLQVMGDEEKYTIPMQDFFQMPDIDFIEIAKIDRDVRALFN